MRGLGRILNEIARVVKEQRKKFTCKISLSKFLKEYQMATSSQLRAQGIKILRLGILVI